MGSTGRAVANNNQTSEFRLGDEVLLETGRGIVTNMTIIDVQETDFGREYQLRPSNEVTSSTFDEDEYNSQFGDMFVDEAYIRRNRLRNIGR